MQVEKFWHHCIFLHTFAEKFKTFYAMGTINSIIQSAPNGNVQIIVSVQDLKEFMLELMQETTPATPADPQDEYLCTDEVSRILHVKETAIWRLTKAGRLTFTKVGRKRLFKKADVLSLL